jgi:hypothetical protein
MWRQCGGVVVVVVVWQCGMVVGRVNGTIRVGESVKMGYMQGVRRFDGVRFSYSELFGFWGKFPMGAME